MVAKVARTICSFEVAFQLTNGCPHCSVQQRMYTPLWPCLAFHVTLQVPARLPPLVNRIQDMKATKGILKVPK